MFVSEEKPFPNLVSSFHGPKNDWKSAEICQDETDKGSRKKNKSLPPSPVLFAHERQGSKNTSNI